MGLCKAMQQYNGDKGNSFVCQKEGIWNIPRRCHETNLKRRTRFLAKKPIAHKTAVENIEAMTKRVHRSKTIFSQVQEDWSTKLLG